MTLTQTHSTPSSTVVEQYRYRNRNSFQNSTPKGAGWTELEISNDDRIRIKYQRIKNSKERKCCRAGCELGIDSVCDIYVDWLVGAGKEKSRPPMPALWCPRPATRTPELHWQEPAVCLYPTMHFQLVPHSRCKSCHLIWFPFKALVIWFCFPCRHTCPEKIAMNQNLLGFLPILKALCFADRSFTDQSGKIFMVTKEYRYL